MKKILISTAITAVLALSLVGCGNSSKSISPKSLPASGATTFVSSDEDLAALFTELSTLDIQNEPAIMLMGAALANVDPEELTPNLMDIYSKEESRAEEYVTKLMSDDKDGFAQTGKASYAINRNIGTIKGLPDGITAAIPTASAKADVVLSKNGKSTANGNFDVSTSVSFDAVKLIGEEDAESSIIKGAVVNVATKGDIKGNLISKEVGKDSSYLEVLYSVDDANATINASVELNVGYSICAPSGLGGKAVATIKISVNDTFTQDSIADLENTFNSIMYGREPSQEDLDKLPVKFEITGKLYNDSGKETYSSTESYNLYELYTELAPVLEMLEELL